MGYKQEVHVLLFFVLTHQLFVCVLHENFFFLSPLFVFVRRKNVNRRKALKLKMRLAEVEEMMMKETRERRRRKV